MLSQLEQKSENVSQHSLLEMITNKLFKNILCKLETFGTVGKLSLYDGTSKDSFVRDMLVFNVHDKHFEICQATYENI